MATNNSSSVSAGSTLTQGSSFTDTAGRTGTVNFDTSTGARLGSGGTTTALSSGGSLSPVNTSANVSGGTLNSSRTSLYGGATVNSSPITSFANSLNQTQYANGLAPDDPSNKYDTSTGQINTNYAQAPQDAISGDEKQIKDLMTQLGYQPQDYQDLQNQYNISGMQSQLGDLNNQYAQAQSQFNNSLQTIGAQNIPSLFVSGQMALERAAAATTLGGIAAQQQAVQGNINSANQIIQNTLKVKYDTIQSNLDNLVKYYQTVDAPKLAAQVEAQKTNIANTQAEKIKAQTDMQAQITAGTIDTSTGYSAMGELLSGKISVGDFYKKLGMQQPNGAGSVGADPVTNAMEAIVGNESGGNYQAISKPIVSGTYAGHQSYGKYQVLDVHISDWTKQATGTAMTPAEFLASPEAQDAVAKMQIGNLWNQYGNIADVASVWFTGKPAAQSKGAVDSTTGMTSEQYIQKATNTFNNLQNATTVANPQYADILQGKSQDQINYFNSLPELRQSDVSNLIKGTALLSDLITTRGIQGSNAKQQLIMQAQKVDPTFSENTNKIRFNYNKDWNDATTTVGKTKVSINTALNHLAEVKNDTLTLSPTDVQQLNKLKNWWEASTGNINIMKLQTALTALSSEVATVYKGGTQPSDQEINAWKQVLGTQLTTNQFDGVLNQTAQLLSGKISSLNYNYKSTMGTTPPQSVIDPETRNNLIQSGIDPSSISKDPSSITLKDPKTGETKVFSNLSPNDLQDALKQGFIQQ